MSTTELLNDERIEAIVAGDEVDPRFDQLVVFARQVRALGDEATPPPSPGLRAVFAGVGDAGAHGQPGRASRSGRLATATAKVAGLGLVAKIALGTSLAAAGVLAAGASGVLPDPATARVRDAIDAVVPFDFGSGPGDPAHDGDRFGDRVSSDATGESDGTPGVDGREVSRSAPGADHRPGADGPGHAGDTPAASNLPDSAANRGTTPAATGPGTQDPSSSSTGATPSAPASTVPTTGASGGGPNSTAQGG